MATPIGNLRDITLRALDILSASDMIYCEDTRVTQRLLSAYGIHKPLERCDGHTEQKRAEEIITAIKNGKIIVFASDAGTPGISDPGTKLVAACIAAGLTVSPVPGASAAIAAFSAAASLSTGNFMFLGFLPLKSGARRKILHQYISLEAVLVFYEAPQRVPALLEDIQAIMGEREVVIARELTKLHERFYRGTPAQLLIQIQHDNFKGEIVAMIMPSAAEEGGWDEGRIDRELAVLLTEHSLKESVAQVTAQSGISRKIVYARALAIGRKDA